MQNSQFIYLSHLSWWMSQCVLGCSWVPQPVFGPVEGWCGENEQELDKWRRVILLIFCGEWKCPGGNVISSQSRARGRGGHIPHLHLPRGSKHGIWGATHNTLQMVRPVFCSITWIYPFKYVFIPLWLKCCICFCCSCGEVVTKREQFNDLSIDLPRRKKTLPLRSIQDSLDLFFRVSLLNKHYLVQSLYKDHSMQVGKLITSENQQGIRCPVFFL